MTSGIDRFEVPFGTGTISFSMPDGVTASVAKSRHVAALTAPIAAAQEVIQSPIGARRLRELAIGARTACIAVTDATRNCPDHLLVPPLLSELGAAGVPDDGITIL